MKMGIASNCDQMQLLVKKLFEIVHNFAVKKDARDELEQLANDFNNLALTLEKNERSRRQWVADVSHELRTPLTMLRGEIEALQDGIRKPGPESLHSLRSEVLHLSRLVDDLFQLSFSDLDTMSYKKEELDCNTTLLQTVDSFRSKFATKKIDLDCKPAEGLACLLLADEERLRQLFNNLLENSLKYTDSGGSLLVFAEYADNHVMIHFLDSAPGVPEQYMERLFERLFRVESSRNMALRGSGLGLSICKNIVDGHGGTIKAFPSPLGGLWIRVVLPLLTEML